MIMGDWWNNKSLVEELMGTYHFEDVPDLACLVAGCRFDVDAHVVVLQCRRDGERVPAKNKQI
jgi:hypothetical protein